MLGLAFLGWATLLLFSSFAMFNQAAKPPWERRSWLHRLLDWAEGEE